MNNPPSYLTTSEKERWVYAQGNKEFIEISREMLDLEDELVALEELNDRQFLEIQELEAELETFTT